MRLLLLLLFIVGSCSTLHHPEVDDNLLGCIIASISEPSLHRPNLVNEDELFECATTSFPEKSTDIDDELLGCILASLTEPSLARLSLLNEETLLGCVTTSIREPSQTEQHAMAQSQHAMAQPRQHAIPKNLVGRVSFAALAQQPHQEVLQIDDELLGPQLVSTTKFPMLTPAGSPEEVFIFPGAEQLKAIHDAQQKPRLLRLNLVGNGTGGDAGAAAAAAAGAALDGFSFDPYIEALKIFIELVHMEYGSVIVNRTVVDRGILPFDQTRSHAYFRLMELKKTKMMHFLDNSLTPILRNLAKNLTWLPVNEVIHEIRACEAQYKGLVGDEYFDYNKNTGGRMIYYRVGCFDLDRREDGSVFIGLSIYGNEFVFHDIERIVTTDDSFNFLDVIKSHKSKDHHTFEKPYLNQEDKEKLRAYTESDFAERVRKEYRQYLEYDLKHPRTNPSASHSAGIILCVSAVFSQLFSS